MNMLVDLLRDSSGYGGSNLEGNATEMVVANTLFKKRESRQVIYQSSNSSTQLDYVFVRKSYRNIVKDVKFVAGEICAPQHKLVVCALIIKSVKEAKRPVDPRQKIWKLRGCWVCFLILNFG